MQDKGYWTKAVSRMLKTEMAKRDISYGDLSSKLNELGLTLTPHDLRARFSRGNFSAVLFIQCLKAMGVKNLMLEDSFFESTS